MAKSLLMMLTGLLLSTNLTASPSEPVAQNAARQVIQTMKMEDSHRKIVAAMIDSQCSANPQLRPFRQQIADFFNQYLSWESMRDDMVKAYAQEFTIEELRALNDFYRTPAGRNIAAKTARVNILMTQLTQQRLQKHLPKLYQSLAGEMMKQMKKR